MTTQVTLPNLGDGIESGEVLEIFVSEGDVISEGQDIAELETDKATVTVPASSGGKIVKILISEGDSVPIGGVLLEVEAGSEATAQPEQPAAPEPAAPAAPQSPAPPPQPEPQATAPAPATPAPAPPAPAPAAPAAPQSTSPPPAAAPAPATGSSTIIPAGPAIRRFAREVGVDLAGVTGSGDGGRITREDVLEVVRHSNQGRPAPAAPSGGFSAAESAPVSSTPVAGDSNQDEYGPIRVERMSKIRRTIAEQMHASWSQVPRVTNFDDADITELEQLRQTSKADYEAQGIRLTTMPFLIKAIATALKHNPAINAVIDEANGQLIYKEYVNVGIAVDTDRGLVVPVMKNADKMGVPDIARALAEMAANVRSGQFAVSDLRGGTFTISNLGAIGGQYSTPIVNVPEVAILLVGRSRKLPCVMPDDSIQARLTMPLSLSYDHRLVDGGTAARFLNHVIEYLEAPSRLLLAL